MLLYYPAARSIKIAAHDFRGRYPFCPRGTVRYIFTIRNTRRHTYGTHAVVVYLHFIYSPVRIMFSHRSLFWRRKRLTLYPQNLLRYNSQTHNDCRYRYNKVHTICIYYILNLQRSVYTAEWEVDTRTYAVNTLEVHNLPTYNINTTPSKWNNES